MIIILLIFSLPVQGSVLSYRTAGRKGWMHTCPGPNTSANNPIAICCEFGTRYFITSEYKCLQNSIWINKSLSSSPKKNSGKGKVRSPNTGKGWETSAACNLILVALYLPQSHSKIYSQNVLSKTPIQQMPRPRCTWTHFETTTKIHVQACFLTYPSEEPLF